MKKISLFLAAAVLSLGFTACEDVPAPYEINNGTGTGGNTPSAEDILLNESFASSLGKFSAINTEGDYPWTVSYSCAQVTSYVDTDGDGQKENVPAVSWLVSPQIDLTDVEAAHVSFSYILRYATNSQMATHYQVLVSKDYDGSDVTAATWEPLGIELVQGADWDTWYDCNVNLPESYCKTDGVTIALRYTATTKAATWEVKNFTIKKGAYESDAPDADGVRELPYSEEFSTTLGGFKSYTTEGSGEWVIDFKTAKATGYDNATKVTTAGTYYLVSPEISLNGQTAAYISYEYILRYNKEDANQQVLVNAAFDENNPGAGWTVLKEDHKEGTDWNTFSSADIQLPADLMGKNVRIAFRYSTNDVSGSTWEVRNFSAKSGQAGGGDTPDTPAPPAGDNLLVNGDFEGWTGGKPNNWATASTAGNATLSQSTDAHGGNYSVNVAGLSSANKRLGYKETRLKAGTYTMKFYAKAATADGASVRPGYATFNADGSINGSGYKYGDYVNNLSNSQWTEVTHEFTLDTEQQICLVVMNSKNPGAAVLIDDFSLTTGNGGIAEGGGTPTPDEPAPTEGIFSESFANGLGAFTIDNKQMPDALTYIWSADTNYGYAKASAYSGQSYDSESWLISPVIDLTKVSKATLSFSHTINKGDVSLMKTQCTLWAKAAGSSWEQVAIQTYPAGTSWTFVNTEADLGKFAGKSMQFAFVYKSTSASSCSWEIKNVVVK